MEENWPLSLPAAHPGVPCMLNKKETPMCFSNHRFRSHILHTVLSAITTLEVARGINAEEMP